MPKSLGKGRRSAGTHAHYAGEYGNKPKTGLSKDPAYRAHRAEHYSKLARAAAVSHGTSSGSEKAQHALTVALAEKKAEKHAKAAATLAPGSAHAQKAQTALHEARTAHQDVKTNDVAKTKKMAVITNEEAAAALSKIAIHSPTQGQVGPTKESKAVTTPMPVVHDKHADKVGETFYQDASGKKHFGKEAKLAALDKYAAEKMSFTKTDRPAGGSQGGSWYRDSSGKEHFGKNYGGNTDRLHVEHLTNQIYRKFGASAPETAIHHVEGKPILMSKEIVGKQSQSEKDLHPTDIHKHFVVDAFLGNHDVVGLTYDNVIVHGGKAHRVDNGGSMVFRAMGGKKEFTAPVNELKTMRDTKYQAGKVFSKLDDAAVHEQVKDFVKKWDTHKKDILDMVDKSGLSGETKAHVRTGLTERAEWLRSQVKTEHAPKDKLAQMAEHQKKIGHHIERGYVIEHGGEEGRVTKVTSEGVHVDFNKYDTILSHADARKAKIVGYNEDGDY